MKYRENISDYNSEILKDDDYRRIGNLIHNKNRRDINDKDRDAWQRIKTYIKRLESMALTLANNNEMKSNSCDNCYYSDILKDGQIICTIESGLPNFADIGCIEHNYWKWKEKE